MGLTSYLLQYTDHPYKTYNRLLWNHNRFMVFGRQKTSLLIYLEVLPTLIKDETIYLKEVDYITNGMFMIQTNGLGQMVISYRSNKLMV